MTRRRLKETKASNHWIGARLARLRRLRNMTQQEVGQILNRTDSAVSDIENGYSDITIDHLLRVAEGLGIPAAGLLLPDPGATAIAPFVPTATSPSPTVIELLASDRRRALLTQLFERVVELPVDQLEGVVAALDKVGRERISAA